MSPSSKIKIIKLLKFLVLVHMYMHFMFFRNFHFEPMSTNLKILDQKLILISLLFAFLYCIHVVPFLIKFQKRTW